jgi:hypothetical protein
MRLAWQARIVSDATRLATSVLDGVVEHALRPDLCGRLGAYSGVLGNLRRLVVRVLDMIFSVTEDSTRIGGR